MATETGKGLLRGFALGVAACFVGAFATAAAAQATRTWLSGVGDDVNPCSRTAPCKTFAGAISKTAANGEINILDPGGYGTVTITKSITLDGTGALGSILASGVQGVIINITDAASSKKVTLRNLEINGTGTTFGTNGINVISAAEVIVDGLNIYNFSNAGILVAPVSGSPAAKVMIERTRLERTGVGLKVDGVNVPATTVFLSDSTITQNTTGIAVSGGATVTSFNNNRIAGNGTDGGPTQTIYQR